MRTMRKPVLTVVLLIILFALDGSVKRGWLGVTIQDVSSEHARSFGLTKTGGAMINRVGKDTPAARANLEIGELF